MKNTLSAVYRREIKATDLKQARRKTFAAVFGLLKIFCYKSIVNIKIKVNLNVSIIYKTNTTFMLLCHSISQHASLHAKKRKFRAIETILSSVIIAQPF